ncbi:DUF1553 domain-containing protein [Lignipirellula cremea]|uniref:Planctomycete cytochrome C n=1 Tax=Lignipirellula cremea TaxID=2528010 RepID=A0A518DLW2_9BACT|nr:PSD1 and planctomycete cytochrome C domain-containing protein [Lignipirellula cremea]QDU92815.1 Planctomycete cytochrome C [Lignipirellula cremea]
MASSFCCRPADASRSAWGNLALFCLLLAVLASPFPLRAEEPAGFLRGINLNGPPVTIDGHEWEGRDSKNYVCRDKAFESQGVNLTPATDVSRATMIRSSRWGGNRLELTNLPAGSCSLFLYVWEDNREETFAIAVNGQTVDPAYRSGEAGHWEKLGPWPANVIDGRIVITSKGGAANFSGVEIWTGPPAAVQVVSSAAAFRPEELAFFENRIRPLLIKHCYECHSADSDELQGDLLVDSRPTLLRGGLTGPAIVPGDLEHSLLIEAVRYQNDAMQMPPDAKLSAAEIADLEQWVKSGAADPRNDATRFERKRFDLAEARQFWSLRPIADPTPPAVQQADWPFSPIDQFVLAALEAKGWRPEADADKRTLLRRATFDLTGLPPSPEEIAAFLADDSPGAFERVVERLLESPRYGERWGRHWMDLVRYADTAGDNSDYPIPQAYLYRNYIINAFNADKPYDQFLREQLAGDLLPAENDAQRNEQTIATGYIASSRRFGSLFKYYPQHLTIEDTIDNLGRTMLGLTISCARCHDHKFDPISQDDYYALYGVFSSTRYPFPGIELDKKPRDFVPLWESGKPGSQLAYAVAEGKPADAKIHLRGEPKSPGDVAPRRFLEVLGGQTLAAEEARQSGRRQLADWITDPQNPLTARVMANRIWQHHFGNGLVKTPSDFGLRGQPPSHPELLDWLASRLQEDGWSIKQLHRRILLSRTYQLQSQAPGDATSAEAKPDTITEGPRALDPDNTWLSRFSRRRLDAEEVRDTLLLLSGQLDEQQPQAPHPFPPQDKWQYTQHHPFRDSYESNCRSVYLMTARLNARPFFTAFDGPDRNASTAARDSSVTTVQSLYLLNHPFVHDQAEKFAARLLAEESDPAARIEIAFARTLGRPPTPEETSFAATWLARFSEQQNTPNAGSDQAAWAGLARVLFRVNEFVYID